MIRVLTSVRVCLQINHVAGIEKRHHTTGSPINVSKDPISNGADSCARPQRTCRSGAGGTAARAIEYVEEGSGLVEEVGATFQIVLGAGQVCLLVSNVVGRC
jgi:hypothetical protein